MNIVRYRDLTILDKIDEKLVIACDSSEAIGPKPFDVVKVDGYILGRFLARVALMAVISVGAPPIVLIDTLAVEMEPRGKDIISGIKKEVEELGLDQEQLINGSTEENMPVKQTGVGITAIGQGDKLYCDTFVNAYVVCVGLPKIGKEVELKDKEICTSKVVKHLRKIEGVQEIVPVGTKGVAYELNQLLGLNRLTITEEKTALDLKKSGGPATCVLLSVNEAGLEKIHQTCTQPVTVIGQLK